MTNPLNLFEKEGNYNEKVSRWVKLRRQIKVIRMMGYLG